MGAGVAVGSGVGMMALQLAEDEKRVASTPAAASVMEARVLGGRGFAASGAK